MRRIAVPLVPLWATSAGAAENALPPRPGQAPFGERIADPAAGRGNLPVLLHGATTDQPGATWALYRASPGVPPQPAFEDGVTAGVSQAASNVRASLAGVAPKTAQAEEKCP